MIRVSEEKYWKKVVMPYVMPTWESYFRAHTLMYEHIYSHEGECALLRQVDEEMAKLKEHMKKFDMHKEVQQ